MRTFGDLAEVLIAWYEDFDLPTKVLIPKTKLFSFLGQSE